MKLDALSIVANRTVSVGSTIKIIQGNTTAEKYPDIWNAGVISQSVQVDLSSESLRVSALSKGDDAGVVSSKEFDSFLIGVHRQLAERGKGSDIINVEAKDDRPGRLVMAKQAANYLLTEYYSTEAAFSDVSSNNPFEELDRLSLSNIAFDEAGEFTPVERQLAFYEISGRDTEYRNRTFDLQESLWQKDDSVPWSEITSYLRDAQLTLQMSEGEKEWRGWGSAESLKNRALMLAGSVDISKLVLPPYEGAELPDTGGITSGYKNWNYAAKDSLKLPGQTPGSDALEFILAATESSGLDEVSLRGKGGESNSWVVLYSKIDGFTQE